MKTPNIIISGACAIGLAACQCLASEVKQERFGKMPDGREVSIFTLTNKNGLKARVTEYGAILVSMEVPDKNGKTADVTHGYDTLDGWLTNTSYFGSSVGRFGNRIKDGKFTLDGKSYTLATNNEPGGIPCHLHLFIAVRRSFHRSSSHWGGCRYHSLFPVWQYLRAPTNADLSSISAISSSCRSSGSRSFSSSTRAGAVSQTGTKRQT